MAKELPFFEDGPDCGIGRANAAVHMAALTRDAIAVGAVWHCRAPLRGEAACALLVRFNGAKVDRHFTDGNRLDECHLQPQPRSDSGYLVNISKVFDNLDPGTT